jgi:hypothetical protein
MAKATDTRIPVIKPVMRTEAVVVTLTKPEAGLVRNIFTTSFKSKSEKAAAMMIADRAVIGTSLRM